MSQQRQSLGDAVKATSEARKRRGRFLPQSVRGSVTFVICPLVTVSTLYVTLYDPMDCSFLYPWDFPGKSTGVGCHFLLQGTFQTQMLHLHLLHYLVDSLQLSHQ